MILCLDAGNTRVKWGLHDGLRWDAQGAIGHDGIDGLAATLPSRPERVIACNVAGAEVAAAIERLAHGLGAKLVRFSSRSESCGVRNGYDTPEQLGADRWAALVGARALQAGPAVVVMAGTATTVDLLDGEGNFRGGLILPGLTLMRAALARNTAGLPQAAGHYRDVPTNTDDAIVAGSLHATLGAIERMRTRLAPAALVMLSGGAAGELQSHIPQPCHSVQNLVLEGLARFAAGSDIPED